MAELLQNLFTDVDEMVTDMGGGATKDPCVRKVQFYPQVEMSSLEEDKPAWFWAKQKQSDPESTPLIDEVNFKRKKFVPDLVVESMLDVN